MHVSLPLVNLTVTEFYVEEYICTELDNALRRDLRSICRRWKPNQGLKPNCCRKCEQNWRTCYEECYEEIERVPQGT